MRSFPSLIFSCVFLLNTAHGQIPSAVQQRLQDTLNYLQTVKKYRGISAAVSWKGRGEWKGTAGLSHPGKPLHDSMAICIGSNTKTFLAAVVLKLSEAGMLSLSDSVGKWLPPIQNVNSSITISQLLHHTSGIYNYTEDPRFADSVNANPFRTWTKAELVSRFIKAPYFSPGKGWYYSNTNFLLAGIIAEMAGGKNIAELIRDIILTPAGLNHTFFPPYETVVSTPAHIWTSFGSGGTQQSTTLWPEFYSTANCAGALMSDAADNCKFWVSLFNGDIILKTSLRDEMMNWEVPSSSFSYGLGLMKKIFYGNETFSHGGNILGQTCDNLTDTVNGITVSVLTNQDSLQNQPIVIGLYKILLQQNKLTASLPELDMEDFLMFPNPATNRVRVRSSLEFREAAILDLDGRKLFVSKPVGKEAEFNVSELPAGVYFIVLQNESGRNIKKFIRE